MHDAPGGGWRRRFARALLRLAPIGFAIFVQVTWFASLMLSSNPVATARRDWQIFFVTGRRLLAGELDSIYPHVLESGYFWLYPPYCIFLTAPLGLLPEPAAYALCFAVEFAAVVAALVLLRAVLSPPRARYWAAAGIVFASMPFNTTVVMGQVSGILAFIVAAALWAWYRRRLFAAGLLLSLLFIKPNLAVFFPAACLLNRQWAVLAGTISGLALLVLSSLPLGLARWRDYLFTSEQYVGVVRDATPMWKQVTLYAFWRTIPGLSEMEARLLWLGSALALVLLVALAWYRHRAHHESLARLFGLTILLALAINLYAYFYDGLLLMIPGMIWYVGRYEYRSRLYDANIALCIVLLFVVGYLRVFLFSSGVNWAGALIAAWLVLEAFALLTHGSTRLSDAPLRDREFDVEEAVG